MFTIAREGAVKLLSELLSQAGGGEDWLLCMTTAPVEQAEDETAARYLAAEADHDGYARKTLARRIGPDAWGTPVVAAPIDPEGVPGRSGVGASVYSEAASWTVPPGTTITGYFVLGAESGALIGSDVLPCPFVACQGGKTVYTPYIELG